MWLLEEKMDAVEDKEKWWIIELPMRRPWKRIYIHMSPCRLGNYLLILRRMAPMVVSLNLPIFLLDLVFSWEKASEWVQGHGKVSQQVIWILSVAQWLFNLKWESGLHCLLRHEQLITEHPAVLLNTSHNVDSNKSIEDQCRQTAWAELSGKRFPFCI